MEHRLRTRPDGTVWLNNVAIFNGDDDYDGGNIADGQVTVGYQQLSPVGDWNAHLGYKYLESMRTLDASPTASSASAVPTSRATSSAETSRSRRACLRPPSGMSANNIAGAPYAVDVVQVDLNAKF